MRTKTIGCLGIASLAAGLFVLPPLASSQTANQVQNYPSSLPYSFSNFVWWSDDELRALLKKQIPSLDDEVATTTEAESRIRLALKAFLKQKGILAEVQSQEPSYSAPFAERVPGAPPLRVVFTISSPRILVDKVVVSQAPDALLASLEETLHSREGNDYSSGQDWLVRSEVTEKLQSNGYLDSHADVSHGAPRKDGSNFAVNLLVAIASGPQYHISSISADGGPLLPGRDLSPMFAQRPGDIATENPFGRLPVQLRAYYEQRGFADVEIHGPTVLDKERALASYHLSFVPGPMYRLHTLTIQHLDSDQEKRARDLLGMKPGDVFDETAVNGLYRKLSLDPLLSAYSFSFGPKKNKVTATVDLTLDFFKTGGDGSVSIK
jgi:outer membrane translocation and assembly module TamA